MSYDTTNSRDSVARIPSPVHLTVIEGGAVTTRTRGKIVASRIISFALTAKPTPHRRACLAVLGDAGRWAFETP